MGGAKRMRSRLPGADAQRSARIEQHRDILSLRSLTDSVLFVNVFTRKVGCVGKVLLEVGTCWQ